MKLLSLSPIDLVTAITLENEALLYAFFIVFAAVMACAFAIYCEHSFPKLKLFRQQSMFSSCPNRELVDPC